MPLQLPRDLSAFYPVSSELLPIFSLSSISALCPLAGMVGPCLHSLATQLLFLYTAATLFWPVIKVRWHAWCARMRTLSLSSAVRDAAACEFLDGLSPVGQNPLDLTIVTKAWAGAYQ